MTTPQRTESVHPSLGLSRPVSAWTVLVATARKDLRIAWRYFPDLVGRVVEAAIRAFFFLLLARAISVDAAHSPLGIPIAGRDMAVFFQGALLLFVFNGTALNTPVEAIGRDLHNGTLEYLFSNPFSRYAYFVGTIAANGILSLVVYLPLFGLLVFYARTDVATTLVILLVSLTVLVAVVALGVMIGLLGLLWRQVGSVTQVISISLELLTGAYLPVTALPRVLRPVAFALPHTWGYDLIRYYSFRGRWTTLLPVWVEWLLLGLYAFLFVAVSRLLLRRAEKVAKIQGLHLI